MFERHFPLLRRKINDRRLVYLDNAATTQKPQSVIEAISDFYQNRNANIHRGIHALSHEATELYEGVRDKTRKFINARRREEIIFTGGTTDSINLIVWSWGGQNIKRGDEILLTEMEHHANLVPWQILAKKKGARLKFIPVSARGRLELNNLNKLLNRKTKIVSLTHASNVLGTINPVAKIAAAARKKGILILIDGAQTAAREKIDVQKIGCDFFVCSGHKMYGPTGVGVLYAKRELLKQMPPYRYGGVMVNKVTLRGSAWNELPYKFEAGTPPIAQVAGLGAALDFLNSTGLDKIAKHERELTRYALKRLRGINGFEPFGPTDASDRGPVIAFNIKGIPPHDLAGILNDRGIAIRTGHHCAMPLHSKFGLAGTARASFAVYNTKRDVDSLIRGIKYAQSIFGLQ